MSKPTIATIKRRNHEAGFHFFDADTMRFFSSRLETQVFQGNSDRLYFVDSVVPPHCKRVWIVKVCHYDGSIDTVEHLPGSLEDHAGGRNIYFPLAKAALLAAETLATADRTAEHLTGNREKMVALRLGIWDGGPRYGHAARYCSALDFVFMPGHVEKVGANTDAVEALLREYTQAQIDRFLEHFPKAED